MASRGRSSCISPSRPATTSVARANWFENCTRAACYALLIRANFHRTKTSQRHCCAAFHRKPT
eukprot:8464164-Lingulodinium_polyedra.AAC.1